MKTTFQPPFWKKKLRKLPIRPSAVGMASNFGHRSRSRRSLIFSFGRRTSAFGPTLQKPFRNCNHAQLAFWMVTTRKRTSQLSYIRVVPYEYVKA